MAYRIFRGEDQATEIDGRLAQSDQNALVQAFRNHSLIPTELPLRQGWGTLGAHSILRSNSFAVDVSRGLKLLFEYDVKFSPPVSSERVKRGIFELLEASPAYATHKGFVAHDFSAKLIASRELSQPAVFEVPLSDKDHSEPSNLGSTSYSVELTFARAIEISALMSNLAGDLQYRDIDIAPALSALNIVLAQHPRRNAVMVGPNSFFFPAEKFDLGGGLEAWKGLYSSVRTVYKQLMVNVNVTTTALYSEGNLANAMMEVKEREGFAMIGVFLRGVRVVTTHLQHRKTVKKLARRNLTAKQHRIMWEEGNKEVTVEEYFTLSALYLPFFEAMLKHLGRV